MTNNPNGVGGRDINKILTVVFLAVIALLGILLTWQLWNTPTADVEEQAREKQQQTETIGGSREALGVDTEPVIKIPTIEQLEEEDLTAEKFIEHRRNCIKTYTEQVKAWSDAVVAEYKRANKRFLAGVFSDLNKRLTEEENEARRKCNEATARLKAACREHGIPTSMPEHRTTTQPGSGN